MLARFFFVWIFFISYIDDMVAQKDEVIADSLMSVRNYKEALNRYDAMICNSEKRRKKRLLYKAVLAAACCDDIHLSYKYMKILNRKGFIDKFRLETDSCLHKMIKNSKKWRKLIQKMNRQLIPFIEVRTDLKQIFEQDQQIREEMNKFMIENPNKSIPQDYLTKINLLDSIHLDKVTSILNKYGWLSDAIVGEEGNLTLALTLIHTPNLNIKEKFLPIMENAANIGNCSRQELAYMIDKIQLLKGEKQKYGTQFRFRSDGKLEVYPIENFENVNRLRKTADLNTLEAYMKENNIELIGENIKQ